MVNIYINLMIITVMMMSIISINSLNHIYISKSYRSNELVMKSYSSSIDNNYNIPIYHKNGIETELECKSESCILTQEQSEVSKPIKQIQNKDTRYCYFDRDHKCKYNNDKSCKIDGRPCTSNRNYLDHIYGSHSYPTLSNNQLKSRDAAVIIPYVSNMHAHDMNNQALKDSPIESNNMKSSINSNRNKVNTKAAVCSDDNALSNKYHWIESIVVNGVKTIFKVMVSVINYILWKPLK
uniref:Uncharacterized protein n=1 Tax=Chromulina nebulosa TaxID=96789 RepID=A0A7S0SV05_9STRA|mmetsp:Transcript_4346/g.3896  ORF Transcript_4346/g.3896 Transcript_4346/m.3896 type:complete len:238 (+) Transcript_4346:117-830(+)